MSDQWKCETCRYFRHCPSDDDRSDSDYVAEGHCKRYPKQWTGTVGNDWAYPVTPTDDWCGEWKPLNTPG